MQEKLNNRPENDTENNKNLDTLAGMSESFNAEKAKQLVHKYNETHHNQVSDNHDSDSYLTKQESLKNVEALTPQEASKEHLDTLIDLSKGFTQKEDSFLKKSVLYAQDRTYSSGLIAGDNTKVVKNLLGIATGKNYTDEHNKRTDEIDLPQAYNSPYYLGKEKEKFRGFENPYIQKEYSIALVDEILANKEALDTFNANRSIEQEKAEIAELKHNKEVATEKLRDIKYGKFNKIKLALYKTFNKDGLSKLEKDYSVDDFRSSAEKTEEWLYRKLDNALSAAYEISTPEGVRNKSDYVDNHRESIRQEQESHLFNENNREKINRAYEIRHKLIKDGLLPENPRLFKES